MKIIVFFRPKTINTRPSGLNLILNDHIRMMVMVMVMVMVMAMVLLLLLLMVLLSSWSSWHPHNCVWNQQY